MKLEKINKHISIVSGFAFKPSFFNEIGEGLPLVRVRDVNSGFKGLYYSGKFDERYKIGNGDILVGMDGDFKCVEWNNGEAVLNQRVCKIIPKSSIDKYYLLEYLPEALREIHRKTTFTTVKHLSVKKIENIKIPLPSLTDQKRIAKVLSHCVQLIQKRKQSINILDEFLKSTFLEMFGDPAYNHKKYNVGTIKDMVSEVKYGTSKSAKGGDLPYLRMNNIDINGYWNLGDLKYINLDEKEKNKCVLSKGDVVFNRTNSKELVGKTGIYDSDKEMVIAGYLIRVRTNEKCNPYYLWGHLNSAYSKKRLFNLCRNIVGMANINATELQKITILKPPIEEQNKFELVALRSLSIKNQYQHGLQELENLYGSLSQKAFKGELDLGKVKIEEEMKVYKKSPWDLSLEDEADLLDMLENNPEQLQYEPSDDELWESNQKFLKDLISSKFQNVSFTYSDLENAFDREFNGITYYNIKKFLFQSIESRFLKQTFSTEQDIESIQFELIK